MNPVTLLPTGAPVQQAVDFSSAFANTLMQVQRIQLTWQNAIASCNQELWDEWVCRWGGGAPFDA